MPEDTHLLDPMAILAALGAPDAQTAVPVEGGSDTAIWRVERPEGSAALRLFRTDQVETCSRELSAMRAAVTNGLPAPTVYVEGNWKSRPALLLSWCPGRPLMHELREKPSLAAELGHEFGRVQARINALAAPDDLSADGDDWIRWSGPEEGALQARLHAVSASSRRLLHLDYHPLNVLTDGRRISAVLDWANSHAGDPRADAARTVSILRLSPVRPGSDPVFIARLRRVLQRAWRHGYEEIAGPLGDLTLFYAWAGAVMLRDLAPRVDRPGTGIRTGHIDRIRRWTRHWKVRAGLGSVP
jgi:aminoglycoside phosphotransferase (APT) family kinase protein